VSNLERRVGCLGSRVEPAGSTRIHPATVSVPTLGRKPLHPAQRDDVITTSGDGAGAVARERRSTQMFDDTTEIEPQDDLVADAEDDLAYPPGPTIA
jgi:hypothetical protein